MSVVAAVGGGEGAEVIIAISSDVGGLEGAAGDEGGG